jgi:hypothetical protein
MPRGGKSKYTSKQKRKAHHIEEGTRSAGSRRTRPNAAPMPRSTSTRVVARRRIGKQAQEAKVFVNKEQPQKLRPEVVCPQAQELAKIAAQELTRATLPAGRRCL